MSTAQELSRLPAFRDCPPAQIQALVRLAPTTAFKPDTVLLTQGEVAQGALLILSGRCRAEVQSGERRMVLGRPGPGELIGELGLFCCGARRTATVIAEETVHALVLLPPLLEDRSIDGIMQIIERRALDSMAGRVRKGSATTLAFTEEEDDDPSTSWVSSVMTSLRRLVGG